MPIGSFKLNSISAAAGAPAFVDSYWFAKTGGSGEESRTFIATDSNSNVYSIFQTNSSTLIGSNDVYVNKRNSEGSIQWSRRIGRSGYNYQPRGITVDSSGNVFLTIVSTTEKFTFVFKLDSSGAVSNSLRINGDNSFTKLYNAGSQGNQIKVGSTYAYLAGASGTDPDSNTDDKISLIAINKSTLEPVWTRRFGDTSNNDYVYDLHIDASENVYLLWWNPSENKFRFGKWDSSGNNTFIRRLNYSGSIENFSNIKTDSSGNIYITGRESAVPCGWLTKISSDGATVSYTKTLNGSDIQLGGYSLYVDSSDNVYWLFGLSGGTGRGMIKFNSSGTVQWQRRIVVTGQTNQWIDLAGNDYSVQWISNLTFTDRDSVVFKIPLDGTKTGTYTLDGRSFVYDSMSLTLSTITFTTVSDVPTIGTGLSGSAAVTYTTNTTELTSALVSIT
jgi:hypothetical protein